MVPLKGHLLWDFAIIMPGLARNHLFNFIFIFDGLPDVAAKSVEIGLSLVHGVPPDL